MRSPWPSTRPVERSRGMPLPRSVRTVPVCVPGSMCSSSLPASVGSSSVVPSAAAVIGSWTVQCRSAPSRVKTSWGTSSTSTYRSPAGAAARADLALVGEPHPHAVGDAGRDPHADVAPRAHPAVAAALPARARG